MKHHILFTCLILTPFFAYTQDRTVLFETDFSTYENGNLAGQNGWVQYGTIATEPIQIMDGKLILKSGLTGLHQTVIFSLNGTIPVPASGLLRFEVDMTIRPTSNIPPTEFPNYFIGMRRDNSAVHDEDNTPIALGGIRYADASMNNIATMTRLSESPGHTVGFLQGVSANNANAVRLTYTMAAGANNDQTKFGSLYFQDNTLYTTPMPTQAYFDNNEVSYHSNTRYFAQSGTSTSETPDPESVGALMLRHIGSGLVSGGFEITYLRWSVFGQFVVSTPEVRELPAGIALHGAYPNPFNPSTVIGFTLDAPRATRLAVYDMLGRQVATLIDGNMPAGEHKVTFDAAGLGSGVYLVRLEAGGMSMTRRITLLK